MRRVKVLNILASVSCFALNCGCVGYNVNGTILPLVAISDSGNNRILLWKSFPFSAQQAADLELGQPNFFTSTPNTGGVSAQTLNNPLDVFDDGTRLFVADRNNNRVLIWNELPTVNGQPADVVLGQPTMGVSTANNTPGFPGTISAQGFSGPDSVFSTGTQLIVSDSGNNRILIWNSIPTVNQKAADIVLGQSAMNLGAANGGGGTAANVFFDPTFYTDGQRLLVADFHNNRVLFWNTFPTTNGQSANIVLGQSSFSGNSPNASGLNASAITGPTGVYFDGLRTIVGDSGNNRVLIWNEIPTSLGQPADVVLGQPDMFSSTSNNGGPSAQSIGHSCYGIRGDGKRLYLNDAGNNRTLIWNSFPTINQQPADIVLGQSNMVSIAGNGGGLAASNTLSGPTAFFLNWIRFGVQRPDGY